MPLTVGACRFFTLGFGVWGSGVSKISGAMLPLKGLGLPGYGNPHIWVVGDLVLGVGFPVQGVGMNTV